MAVNDLILYSTEDGLAQFSLREMNDQVWLTQLELAELYQSSKQNINKHIQAVLAEGGAGRGSSCQLKVDNCC